MTWLMNSYRFGQVPVVTTPVKQWRVWMLGAAAGGLSDTNVRVAGVQMATSPGGADIAATGVSSASAATGGTAAAFDGDPGTNFQTSSGDKLWLQTTFPAAVLLAEVRIQAPSSLGSQSAPQCVVILTRNDDAEPWRVVHVSTGVVWTTGEWKTFSISSESRLRGIEYALAWRIRWTKASTDSFAGMSFDGVPNNSGQAFARYSIGLSEARKAFDGNAATNWTSTGIGEVVIGQIMAVPAEAVPTAITMVGLTGSAVSWTPTSFVVEWTDDLETWNLKASVTFATWTTPPQMTQTAAI